ncbi:MAG TPA: efflux RND transporter permease subunit [Burkholderiales bacterium]|nr:efflux RND transporter permease subunit [Burkholderiales bacterium]
MMGLVRLALRRPYTVAVLSLLILLLGALSAQRMIVDFFPKIDIPVVFVGWNYPGLSAEEMERRVVIISERAYSTTVSGIERIESSCIPGTGLVKVFFHPGMDIGAAIAQINAINGTVLRILPPGISPPVIIRYSPATVPIVNMTFFSKVLPEGRLFDHAFNFVRIKLFTIPGMQVPAPFGGRLRQISVDLNPTLMRAKGVSPNDVVQALQTSNLLIPSGTARIGGSDYNVLMNSSPPTVDEFNKLPLRVVDGVPVTLGDVAKAEDGFAVQNNIVHVDGRRATYLTILKHADASSLAVVESTRDMLPEIKAAAPEGMEISLDFDQSVFVRAAIKNVLVEAVLASGLVSLMVLLFLGSWRNTIVVITSIPCAMFAGVICLYLTGHTINLMTLGGLALATGILVDDATVAVENIHRNRTLGKPLTVAIIEGSREVALPRTMATLAIAIVFFPVAFLYGVSKYLFTPLALAVVFSLLASYVLSFTLVPMLSRSLLAAEDHAHAAHAAQGWSERFNAVRERFLDRLRNGYGAVLAVVLHHRMFVLVMMVVGGVISALLMPLVGTDFFPTPDVGIMKLHYRAPIGTRIEETEKLVLQVEDEIRKIIPAQEVERIQDMVGVPIFFNLALVPTDNVSGMDAEILILLKKPHKPVAHYMQEIRTKVPPRFPGSDFYFQNADIVTQVLNFGLPAPVDVQVQDANFERAQKYAALVKTVVAGTPGAVDVRQMQVLDYPALRVDVDRLRAARLGLSQRDVATSALVSLSSSAIISPSYYLNPNGVNYTVSVQTPIDKVQTVEDLMSTPMTPVTGPIVVPPGTRAIAQTPTAPVITLGNIATVKPELSYQSVSHYTVQRVIDIAANVVGRDLGSTVDEIKQKIAKITSDKDFPKTAKILLRGQYEVMQASFGSLLLGLLLAIVLVYALLVILFQSWLDPFIIMMAVPGTLIGIVWMLAATGTTFNVMSLMGAIMAVGIGVSNSILVVSFANEVRVAHPNLTVLEAALEAGKTRLRPVLMTALAMIIGMVPMALGFGEAGEQNAPLGRAVIGGLIVATVSTLFVVPVVYTLLRRGMPTLHELDSRFEAEARGESA